MTTLFILFAIISCSPNRSMGIRIKGPDGVYHLEPRVVINNRYIEKNISIDAIDSRKIDSGLLQVQVRIRNLSSKQLSFVYRYSWMDENGFSIESAANGWNDAWIEGYETKEFNGIAPSLSATMFRFEIQNKQ